MEDSLDAKLGVGRVDWKERTWRDQVYYIRHDMYDLLNPLRRTPDLSVDLADAVYRNIIMSTFGAKKPSHV